MKLVTYQNSEESFRAGIVRGEGIIDIAIASKGEIPSQMEDIIENYYTFFPRLQEIAVSHEPTYQLSEVTLHAPLRKPSSVRDFYAFEEHVKTARMKRGLDVVPEWYEIPVFYFTNHRAIIGPNESVKRPALTQELDFELEIACIIGKSGSNIRALEADEYIIGYCIMNDWSARDLQRKEMNVGLGPAKGKDFATSLGPYIVTKDELEKYRLNDRYDLTMSARINGKTVSTGNFASIYYTFADMIEHASRDATLYPGDVIGSGTVGSGCILELGTDVHRYLVAGDEVELEITGLGILKNQIIE